MKDKSAEVRSTSARAMGEIGDKSAVAALAEAMDDGDVEVRRKAVKALGDVQ